MSEQRPSKQKRMRMREVVERLQKYIATYSDQPNYDLYSDETFIKDILYGIGIALDPNEYRCADGFEKFKPMLLPHVRGAVEPAALLKHCNACGYTHRAGGPCPDENVSSRAQVPPDDRRHVQRLNEISHSLAAQLCAIAEPNGDGMIRRESVMDLVTRWRRQWDALTKTPVPELGSDHEQVDCANPDKCPICNPPETSDRQWLIRKRGYYYRPSRAGYTASVAAAGRYTEEEAKREAAIEPSIMQAIHVSQAESEEGSR